MSETLGSGYEERSLEREKAPESLTPRSPETAEDLRKKEVFWGGMKPVEERLKWQLQAIEPVVKELETKSQSYLDTLKADNYLLLVTEGTTVTYEDLQAFREYAVVLNTRANAVRRIAFRLASGERWEDVGRSGEMKGFLSTPEGKFMERLSAFGANPQEATNLFYLEKAQELSQTAQLGRNGKLLAEGYCESLKWTPFEQQAQAFCPSKVEKFADWTRELARELLSLDQLFIMAASGLVWRWVAAWISWSEKAVRVSARVLDKIERSPLKHAIPGVETFATKAADGKISKGLKVAWNLSLDMAKFAAYESLAKAAGNEDVAKATAIALALLPWAKAGFERELRKNPMAEAESALAFAEWVITNKGESGTREELYNELRERYMVEKGLAMVPREASEDMRLMADDCVRLLKTAREGGKINQAARTVETSYGRIAKDNASTADIYRKLNDGRDVRMKAYEHPVTHEKFSKVAPESYLPAYREGLSKLAKHMEGVRDWTLMSSNTLFLTVGKFKTAPSDLDVIAKAEDFQAIFQKFHALEAKGEIGGLKLLPIDGKSLERISPENLRQALESGNLKMSFYYKTGQKIPENGWPLLMDTEVFFDAKGKGLVQLGEIPRALETFSIDWHKIKTLSPYDSVETYTFNLLDESRRNSIDSGWKAKDATRIYNLLSYLWSAGVRRPEDIVAKMDTTVAKYRKYAGAELSKNFEQVFDWKDLLKERIAIMIRDFNDQIERNVKRGEPGEPLPDFEKFTAEIDDLKDKMRSYYRKAVRWEITVQEKKEAKDMLGKFDIQKIRNGRQLAKPEDFAYFYEYANMEERFAARLRQEIK